MPGSDKPAPPIDLSHILPKAQGGIDLTAVHRVLRKNAKDECGEFLGNINLALQNGKIEAAAFYCNGKKLHRGACAFVSTSGLIVQRARQ
jgi:hypothetical protein